MNAETPKKSGNTAALFVLVALILAVAVAGVLIVNPFDGSKTASTKASTSQSAANSKTGQPATPAPASPSTSPSTATTQEPKTTDPSASGSTSSASTTSDPWKAQIDAEARVVLEKAVAAQGGLDALRKLTSIHTIEKGDMSFVGSIEAETWIRLPDQARLANKINFQGREISSIFVMNKQKTWFKGENEQKKQVVEELGLNSTEARTFRSNIISLIYYDPLLFLKFVLDPQAKFRFKDTGDVNGTQATVIEFVPPGGTKVLFYFDPDTSACIKKSTQVDVNGNQVTMEWFYADHKKVNGYLVPFAYKQQAEGQTILDTKYSAIWINEAIDDALFDKPKE